MIQGVNADSCGAQTIFDSAGGKAAAVLDAVKALFFGSRHELAIFDEGGGRVTVVRIYAEDVHRSS